VGAGRVEAPRPAADPSPYESGLQSVTGFWSREFRQCQRARLMVTRLAILSTHPIQYNAPAFRCLAARPDLEVHVFYEWRGPADSIDPEFGRRVEWDVPLLDGYDFTFLPNAARNPGSHHFRGIDNPTVVESVRSWMPDSLLVYGWAFASHLRVLRALYPETNIIFRGDSTLLDDQRFERRVARRALLKWVYRHIDTALYAGSLNYKYFLEHGVREDQLVWAPHAVDNDRFAADSDSRQSEAQGCRRKLGIHDGDLVFMFPAKLVPGKDPWTLLRAFGDLKRSVSDRAAHLVFVGDGELADALRAESAGRDDVHFLGFQNQRMMPVVYRMADIVVLPSLSETWGLSINECMACARPAIVSDRVGCGVDLIRSGETGFVFEHGDSVSLKRAMIRFFEHDRLAPEMGRAAYRLIQGWSIDAYARSVAKTALSASASRRAGK
jgi:glycosyltransferase involved in cell wall biosynthesis